jgi:phage-related protein
MDKKTLGHTKASEEMVNIIGDDKRLSKKISSLMNDFNRGVKEIRKIEDREIRIRLFHMWTESFIINSHSFRSDVSNFLQNMIKAKHREYLPLVNREKKWKINHTTK